MESNKINVLLSLVFFLILASVTVCRSQNRDNLPSEYREYTNPNEVVTFSRNTTFSRAIDVINQFAQKYRGKVVINRSATKGNIGVSIPSMHWMDALKMILRVKKLALRERKDYYEIINPPSRTTKNATSSLNKNTVGNSKAPVATTNTREVRINATFFEGNRRALQEVGVDWSTISDNVPDALLGGGNGGGSSSGGSSGGQNRVQVPNSQFNNNGPFVQVNSQGAQSVSQNLFNSVINFGEIGGSGVAVQALFSAFQADNLGQILGSPTIRVMDGKTGRIQVGQDFSIKQRDIAGNVVDKFFSVGTILKVTPTVITQHDTTFVHLKINAERSSAQPDQVSTVINKQQAETDALMLDGETTAIAGLYSTQKTTVRKGIPILKDLPPWFFGLRYLFGYNSKDYQTKELVVLIKSSLEPPISKRINSEGYDNKYKVLQNERERMRRGIKKNQEIINKTEFDKKSVDKNIDMEDGDSMRLEKARPEKQQSMKKQNVRTQKNKAKSKKLADYNEVKPQAYHLQEPDSTTKQVAHSSSTTTTSAPPASSAQESKNQYYIIGGSFSSEANAQYIKGRLKNEGYDAAILHSDRSDLFMVTYKGYRYKGKAKSALKRIKQNENVDAWLYHVPQ